MYRFDDTYLKFKKMGHPATRHAKFEKVVHGLEGGIDGEHDRTLLGSSQVVGSAREVSVLDIFKISYQFWIKSREVRDDEEVVASDAELHVAFGQRHAVRQRHIPEPHVVGVVHEQVRVPPREARWKAICRFVKRQQGELRFISRLSPTVENVRAHVPIRHDTELTFGGTVPNPSTQCAGEQGSQLPISIAEVVAQAKDVVGQSIAYVSAVCNIPCHGFFPVDVNVHGTACL